MFLITHLNPLLGRRNFGLNGWRTRTLFFIGQSDHLLSGKLNSPIFCVALSDGATDFEDQVGKLAGMAVKCLAVFLDRYQIAAHLAVAAVGARKIYFIWDH